jgi:hypothetical protein
LYLPNGFNQSEKLDVQLRRYRASPDPAVRFLHGHVPLSTLQPLPQGTRFAVLLRDPLARTYSHFNHVFRNRLRKGTAPSLEEALRQRIVDNMYCRMLCGLPEPLTRPADDELIRAAKQRVGELTFVGLTEWFPESMLLARERLGLRSIAYRRENVSGSTVPAEAEAVLRRHDELDVDLYAYARSSLEGPLRALSGKRSRALERAATSLTNGGWVRDPLALSYVVSYAATAYEARVRTSWRKWPPIRVLAALPVAVTLRRLAGK